jgi:transposase
MTHDYNRHGTTTLFAALNILDGTVLGRCMNRHRHQEFIKWNGRSRPARSSTSFWTMTELTNIPRWVPGHPRWVFHFTPTSASWLNAVEGFFLVITRRRIRRGVFTSVADLEDAIRRYIADHNRRARPFVWTKTADEIFEKLSRLPVPSE